MPRILQSACLLLSLSLIAAVESRPQGELKDRPSPGDIVLEDFDSYGLRWEPLVDFEKATLRVAGRQGLVWEWQFQSGETLDYDLLDLEGVPLEDGPYTYEWRVTTLSPEADDERVVKVQSGRFQIQESLAQSLAKPGSEEVFPLATNIGGNHFVGNLTTDSDLCVGCGDGESPASGRASFKGSEDWIVFDEDGPDALWLTGSFNTDFEIWDWDNRTRVFQARKGAPYDSLVIDPQGKIGLGTSTPSASLHLFRSDGKAKLLVEEFSGKTAVRTQFQLENNGAPRFALKNTMSDIEWSFQQSGPGNFLISKEGTGGPELQVYQTGMVRMGPGGANRFNLYPNGNLTIAGSLTANGSTFPDYVFDPDYDLMPLDELATFIQQEKRLPDIPSAEEVKKQGGHNMTALQLKLLEKIEELTLYTLEQEQQLKEQDQRLQQKDGEVEALQRENAQVKARLAAIEARLSDR